MTRNAGLAPKLTAVNESRESRVSCRPRSGRGTQPLSSSSGCHRYRRSGSSHLTVGPLWLGALSACIAVGCAREAAPQTTGTVKQAAVRDGHPGGDAALEGILRSDETSGCLWLGGPGGGTPIVLAGKYTVVFTRNGVVVRKEGKTVAREGQHVSLVGGHIGDRGVANCPVKTPIGDSVFTGGILSSATRTGG